LTEERPHKRKREVGRNGEKKKRHLLNEEFGGGREVWARRRRSSAATLEKRGGIRARRGGRGIRGRGITWGPLGRERAKKQIFPCLGGI